MENKKCYKNNKLLQIREEVFIPFDKIDVIVKQKVDPKTNKELSKPIYVIYLNNSKYNWISVTEEDFEKHIKQYINNF